MMKFLPMKWLVMLVTFSVLSACGGGGGGSGEVGDVGGNGGVVGDWFGDVMTIAVKGPSGTTTTTYNSNEKDPVMFTEAPSGYNLTLTQMDTSAINVAITTAGGSPGTYSVATQTGVRYIVYGSPDTVYGSQTGTVTISSIGAVNEPITGSFQVVASEVSPTVNPSNTLEISGTFSITRRM